MAIIEETAKKIAIPRIEVREKLHGHTKIELRSVRTGRVERIEHDNFFTDGIASNMRSLGVWGNNPFGNTSFAQSPMWANLLGGVFLFDKALPTNPAAKFMPAGTTMTANGSYGVSNSANPPELGSYNSLESQFGANSMTMVYDWGTSQGNGDIASVALTTDTAGYIGYGNKSGTNMGSSYTPYRKMSAKNWSMGSSKILLNDRLYIPSATSISSGTTATVNVYPFGVNTIDAFANPNSTSPILETITFQLPEALTKTYYFAPACLYDKNSFVLFPDGTVSNGQTFKVYILNVSTRQVTSLTIPNPTGTTISTCAYWGGCPQIISANEVVVCENAASGNNYLIDIQNNTSVNLGSMHYTYGYSPYWKNMKFTDELVMFDRGIYDPILKRALYVNGYYSTANTSVYDKMYYIEEGDVLSVGNYLYPHPFRLMTINNLDDTVTKDATKTMKVTYTITRSA